MNAPRWTPEQRAAITSTGHTLLTASAGTGKTTTIIGRLLYRLGAPVEGLEPLPAAPLNLGQIAAITFTERAAHDLADKLRESIRTWDPDRVRELDRATIGTIHGFCAELLREHALRLGIDPTFRVLDAREGELAQLEVIERVVSEALQAGDTGTRELVRRWGLHGWSFAPGTYGRVRDVLREVRWRTRTYDRWAPLHPDGGRRLARDRIFGAALRAAGGPSPEADAPSPDPRDDAAVTIAEALVRVAERTSAALDEWLSRNNARDFDSLVLDVRRLLSGPDAEAPRREIRRRYRVLVIDEFQDTDRAQWEIACLIAGIGKGPADPPGPELLIVGDPKQSIYRFRGANIGVWNEAVETLSRLQPPLSLTRNFRSEPRLIAYVNRAGGLAIHETGGALAAEQAGSVVAYEPLVPGRRATDAAALEWVVGGAAGTVQEQRADTARRVAARLEQLIGSARVVDPGTGASRNCRASDIAILARRRADLQPFEAALRIRGVRFFNTATGGLGDRQEVLDAINALALLDQPSGDLRAFGFLRSPFVGLRDEILTRIGLEAGLPAGTPFLERARHFLIETEAGRTEWFEAPESPHIAETERAALARGLGAFDRARELVDRAPADRVLERLLEQTGYRLHVLVGPEAPEAWANLERLLAFLSEYRHLPIRRFLSLWEAWNRDEVGVPQARLAASGDDVVTLSTVHGAKGLEWPVVVVCGTDAPRVNTRPLVNGFWTDPDLGPVFLPKQEDRGPRGDRALERRILEEDAEEARLLYVAITRARDRLIVAGPDDAKPGTFGEWLAVELPDALEEHVAGEAAELQGTRPRLNATDDDPSTGTGHQMEAFGDDVAADAQTDLFSGAGPPPTPRRAAGWPPMVRIRHAPSIQASLPALPVSLRWLAGIEPVTWPESTHSVVPPIPRLTTSASERMSRSEDPERARLRYDHGVLTAAEFLRDRGGELPAVVRGRIIHGVLERIQAEYELRRILDETIAGLDLAELEQGLAAGSAYREALEAELERVVREPQWRWYVEGPHWRELRFVHADHGRWVQGAFDLYRPAGSPEGRSAQPSLFGMSERTALEASHWIIDFKTHQVGAEEVETIARQYGVQLATYRAAAQALLGETAVRVALHFTHPNRVVEGPAG